MRARTSLLILLALVLWGRGVHGRGSDSTWVSPCTLGVVLVTFKDTSATGNSNLDYHLHDLPYKYTQHGAPGDSSYKLDDFERLFNGGYDENGDLVVNLARTQPRSGRIYALRTADGTGGQATAEATGPPLGGQ